MFKKYQLKNGMTVLLMESHKSPVVSIQMWVKTGSADEKIKEEGISHFIEHLVFKGSRKFKVGEIAATVEASGGELNAYTSFDQTVFYVTISKEFEQVGLNVIAEMMGFPAFEAKEIDNEREVVIEEIKRTNDSPHRQASRLLFSTMFKKHPYGIPVIGYPENIRKVSRATLLKYYGSRYNPANMTLVVAGDFKPADMKKSIQKHFGGFVKNKLRKVKRSREATHRHSELIIQTAPFNETIVHIAFRVPQAIHKDIAAIEALSLILGQGESSRLNQRLRLRDHLVNFAGASVFVAKDPGFLAISLSLNDKDIMPALQATLEEVQEFLLRPARAEELQKALTNVSSEQYYSLETVDGLARTYGHYEDLFGDPTYFDRFLRQLQSLTPKKVWQTARKYMRVKNFAVIVMTPIKSQSLKPKLQKWMRNFEKALHSQPGRLAMSAPLVRGKEALSQKPKKIPWVGKAPVVRTAEIEKIYLPSGVTLITIPNFDTPVLSLRCANLGGSRTETSQTLGASELLSRVWTAGAGELSETDMSVQIDEMAASLSAFSGRNSVGLVLSCLRPFAEPMMDLFLKTLTQPRFELEAVDREIKAMQEHVKLREDNPAQLCVLEFMKLLFGDHPYGRDTYGDVASIGRLSAKSVRQMYGSRSGLTLVAAGAVDVDKLHAQVEATLRNVAFDNGKSTLFPLTYPQHESRQHLPSTKEQSHLIYGVPGLKLDDPNRYTLQVLQAVLAGQGGRLFFHLRDQASLAYSVSPLRMEGLEGGYFAAYIGCSPEKATEALRMIRVEFEKLASTQVGNDELERAQRYLIGKHDISLQRNSNMASAILFDHIYGIDYRETFHYKERIRAVTAAQVQLLAQNLFTKPAAVAIVGPRPAW